MSRSFYTGPDWPLGSPAQRISADDARDSIPDRIGNIIRIATTVVGNGFLLLAAVAWSAGLPWSASPRVGFLDADVSSALIVGAGIISAGCVLDYLITGRKVFR